MYGETLFQSWADPESIWTPWVKPVLFAQIESPKLAAAGDREWQSMQTPWAPPAERRTALVIDLPGKVPLLIGLSLATQGYRPVVLYNCCNGNNPVLGLEQCIETLCSGEVALRQAKLAAGAPPAFLTDSRRQRGDRQPAPGLFDNRWIVFPQDFPSAAFMQSHGIDRAAVIQQESGQPADDLAHVLLRWQEAGMEIAAAPIGQEPSPLQVSRPSQFRYAWRALLAGIGLRPNSAGGFGSVIPIPQSGGSGRRGFG